MASAPACAAMRASCSRVIPQILIRVLTGTFSLGQSPTGMVLDALEVKPFRAKGRGGRASFSRHEHFPGPGGRMLALADVDEGADDVAHHVMQKRVRAQDE